jgi:hypothetical protein
MEQLIDYLTTAVLVGMIVLTFARQSRRRAGNEKDGSSGWGSNGDGCDAGADGGCDGWGGGGD